MKQGLLFLGWIIISATSQAQNSLDFDGIDDYVQTTYAGILSNDPRTIEAWINTSTTTATQHVIVDYGYFGTGSWDNGKRFTLCLNNTHQLRIEIRGWGMNAITPLNDGLWHHVAVSFDGTDVKLYVDGVEEASDTPSITVNTTAISDLIIGNRTDFVKPFEGKIDELRVWDVVRTPAELEMFDSLEYCTIPAGLTGYWSLDEGVADADNTGVTTTVDKSGSNDGTLLNFALSGTTSNWVEGTATTNSFASSQSVTICFGDSFEMGSSTYSSSGSYVDVLSAVLTGCDSSVTTNLTVMDEITVSQSFNECDGFEVMVGTTTYNSTGLYSDTLSSLISGCDSIVTTDLTINSIDISTTVTGLIITANQAGATYQWIDCDDAGAAISGETDSSFTPSENGNYAVIISDGSCSDTSECVAITSVGISTNETMTFSSFPNPASTTLTVRPASGDGVYNLTLRNLTGQVVIELVELEGEQMVDVEELPAGIYVLEFMFDNNIRKTQIVKQ